MRAAEEITAVELLAPVGDITRLPVAIAYGADAVYLSGKSLGMRAACKNFDRAELKAAVDMTHGKNKKCYVTLNIFPNDEDLKSADEYLRYLSEINVDGLIISDLGLIKRAVDKTDIPVHVSTQANIMNSDTAKIYADMGVKRIVLARELSLDQIRVLRDRLDDSVELEAFVHGAMCISYSGRCLLSSYLKGRPANRGECNQACRMRFKPEGFDEPLEFTEDDGTYIFGGNDLNMIEHMSELIDAGVTSFKIEGRVKTEYYVGCVVNSYRHAVDAALKGEKLDGMYVDDLYKAPNRGFNTGFYFGTPEYGAGEPYCDFCGMALSDGADGTVIEMRNRFRTGDMLEILSYDDGCHNKLITVPTMYDEIGEPVTDAKIVCQKLLFKGLHLPKYSMLRKPRVSR